ncbi:MAG: ABC transporter permease [Cystobacterineae bacterium]|nr:ABC transporter permease [Cystobacterineae bacterium]
MDGLQQGASQVGAVFKGRVTELGGMVLLAFQVLWCSIRPPFRLRNFLTQCEFIGVGSAFLVCLTGAFSGMVFAHQSARAFQIFNATSLVGPTVALTITRELAPVFSALMVTMRAGSAMCTELGTMRVTEQVDALETMAINPIQYLLVPRVLAGLCVLPLLVALFDFAGMAGAYLVAVGFQGISAGTFWLRTQRWLEWPDVAEGLMKGAVFGVVVTMVSCYKGFHASGGAKGVGKATTEAMVACALSIFILDYLLGVLLH